MPRARTPVRILTPPADPRRFEPTPERPVRAKARLMAPDTEIQPHHHPWPQAAGQRCRVIEVSALLRELLLQMDTAMVRRSVGAPPGRFFGRAFGPPCPGLPLPA